MMNFDHVEEFYDEEGAQICPLCHGEVDENDEETEYCEVCERLCHIGCRMTHEELCDFELP